MWQDRYKEEKIVVQQSGTHNKFWAAWWDEKKKKVVVRWGRLGTKGQSKEHSHSDVYSASRFIDTKFREKRRKGYSENDDKGRKITQSIFEQMCIEAAIVGSQNKCHSFEWIELDGDGEIFEIKSVTEDRLLSPECNPGIVVEFETRKEHDNRDRFKFVFTFDRTYDVRDSKRLSSEMIVGSSHPLSGLTKKVEEAIGRKLS